jgi:hypothetical protein
MVEVMLASSLSVSRDLTDYNNSATGMPCFEIAIKQLSKTLFCCTCNNYDNDATGNFPQDDVCRRSKFFFLLSSHIYLFIG